jgi:hypothetical protein
MVEEEASDNTMTDLSRPPKLLVLSMALVVAAACQRSERSQDAGSYNTRLDDGVDLGSRPLVIDLELLEQREFQPGDPIELRVTLRNRSDDPLLVCAGDGNVRSEFVSFTVTDDSGSPVLAEELLHADRFYFDERSDLTLLRPTETRSGVLDLVGNHRYDFRRGTYRVVAEYHCPFDGTRVIDGRDISIASDGALSRAVPFDVDYRNWWQVTVDWLLRR